MVEYVFDITKEQSEEFKSIFLLKKRLDNLVDDIYCAKYLEYTDISFISEEYLSLTNQKMANKFIKFYYNTKNESNKIFTINNNDNDFNFILKLIAPLIRDLNLKKLGI
jgi:hypothetical protein